MRYGFGDFVYDPLRMLLLKGGVELSVPRRVYACLSCLIENRERVVKRDDLIRKVWGRDNVSDHQMAQIIRAARQALGDDGNCQCMIRTVMGVGYHWAADIVEISGPDPLQTEPMRAPPMAPLAQPSIEQRSDDVGLAGIDNADGQTLNSPAVLTHSAGTDVCLNGGEASATIHGATGVAEMNRPSPIVKLSGAPLRVRYRAIAIAAAMLLAVLIGILNSPRPADRIASHRTLAPAEAMAAGASKAAVPTRGSLVDLRALLVKGRFDAVRTGLAQLPDALAESPDAGLLEVELNIETGRWPRAAQVLTIQKARADASGDRAWLAQLLILESLLLSRNGAPKPQSLRTAEAAIAILQSMPATAAPSLLANAEFRRAGAWLVNQQLNKAALGFTHARDEFLRLGDVRHATKASCGLARVWMRQGRLIEALEQLQSNADVYAQLDDPTAELMARNTALRLQVELLRLPEALASSDRAMVLLERAPDSERRFRTLQLRAMVMTGLGRLREAESILDDADARRPAAQATGADRLIPAMHQLASANYAQALDSAATAFDALPGDPQNILLDSPDGALLLWAMAVQGLAAQGLSLPEPNTPMRAALQKPESTLSRIAAGCWLWASGQRHDALELFARAMTDARERRQLLRVLLAGNAQMELLVELGRPAAAADVLAAMRTEQPERIDHSRAIWALQVSPARSLVQRD